MLHVGLRQLQHKTGHLPTVKYHQALGCLPVQKLLLLTSTLMVVDLCCFVCAIKVYLCEQGGRA